MKLRALALVALCGCGLFTPASVVPITSLGFCIIGRIEVDAQVAPAMTDTAIAKDVAGFCGVDVATVVATRADRKAALAKAAQK